MPKKAYLFMLILCARPESASAYARYKVLDTVLATRMARADERDLRLRCGKAISEVSSKRCWDTVFETGVHQLYFKGEDLFARHRGLAASRFLEWHYLLTQLLEHSEEERAWRVLHRLSHHTFTTPAQMAAVSRELRGRLTRWEHVAPAIPRPESCRIQVNVDEVKNILSKWRRGTKSPQLVRHLERLSNRVDRFPSRLDLHGRMSDPDDLLLVLLLTPRGRKTARSMLHLEAAGRLAIRPALPRERRELDDTGAGGETREDIGVPGSSGRRLVIYWDHLPLAMLAPIFLHEGTHAVDDSETVRRSWLQRWPAGEPKDSLDEYVNFYRERLAWSAEEKFDEELSRRNPCVRKAFAYYVSAGLNHGAHVSDDKLALLHGINLLRVRKVESFARKERPASRRS